MGGVDMHQCHIEYRLLTRLRNPPLSPVPVPVPRAPRPLHFTCARRRRAAIRP